MWRASPLHERLGSTTRGIGSCTAPSLADRREATLPEQEALPPAAGRPGNGNTYSQRRGKHERRVPDELLRRR